MAWGVDNPMPMDKSPLLCIRKYTSKNSEMLFYDVHLTGIAVQGNAAQDVQGFRCVKDLDSM